MKKGFTLIELLGVVVLLSVVFTITTIVIITFVKDSNDTIDDATKQVLYNATERYLYDEVDMDNNDNYTITVRNLIETNKVPSSILDTVDIKDTSCIKVTIVNGVMNYEFSYACD